MNLLEKVMAALPVEVSFARELREIMLGAVKFHAPNAVDAYWLANDDFDGWDCFPRPLSPWPVTWMEWHSPNTVRVQSRLVESPYRGQVGLLWTRVSAEDGFGHVVWGWLQDDPAEPMFMGLIESGGDGVPRQVQYRPSDRIIRTMPGWRDIVSPIFSGWFLKPAMFAFSLSHCRNALVEEVRTPVKVLKKRRKTGKPTWKAYTLKVKRMRQGGAGVSRGRSVSPSLHIARGHFKTFTAEKPLFGKHSGTYWWESMVRGSPERGVVAKEYEMDENRTEG